MDKKRYAVIEKYSQPFVQLILEKNQQKEIYEKVSHIKTIFEETGLADFLSHIGLDATEKEKSLRFFQPSGSQLLDHLIEILIFNHREDFFYDIILDVLLRIEKLTNEFVVTIQSTQALSEQQKARLIPLIENKLDLKVRSIKEELDASLIGGFVITANNKTIDASIKRQLQVVKENLK